MLLILTEVTPIYRKIHMITQSKTFSAETEIKTINYDTYLSITDCPVQRNHVKRAHDKKTREKLKNLQPQHIYVATVELTENSYDPVTGVTYPKGSTFLIDSHTRREFWRLGFSDYVPEYVVSQHFRKRSIEEIRDLYYTYDNTTNTEKSADLAYGACRYLGKTLKNHKLYQVTGLTWAGHFYDAKQFPKTGGYDGNGLIVLYAEFADEILFLDSIAWSNRLVIPHPLKTAALLFLKKYNNDQARNIVNRIFRDRFDGPDDKDRRDAVTNLLDWVKDKNADFAANYNTIPSLTETFLYWMNQQYLEDTEGKERLYKKGNSTGILTDYARIISKLNVLPLVA